MKAQSCELGKGAATALGSGARRVARPCRVYPKKKPALRSRWLQKDCLGLSPGGRRP